MDLQQPHPTFSPPPPFPFGPPAPSQGLQTTAMDLDMSMSDIDRTQRAASVLSGMSAEDMEAAETLNSLHAKWHSSPQNRPVSTQLQATTTSYNSEIQPEPLLSLLTSQHPIAASLINGSLYAYKTTQSYIPGAEFVERNVGLPLAGTIGRVTGVERGIRRALQRRESTDQNAMQTKAEFIVATNGVNGHDVEKGMGERPSGRHTRRPSEMSFAESLPAYDETGRSPPYQEQQLILQSRETQPPPGWRQQIIITTSGLGIAMSEESLRSLRYCLSWLTWANQRLGGAIHTLKDLLRQWDEGRAIAPSGTSPLATNGSQTSDTRQEVLTARIADLKTDVLRTLKQVVDIVSNYAGGALPENARNLVHRHLISLPQRFSMASAISSNTENGNEAAGSAHRVMVLAQEGLDMMSQVSRVVNDTLVSAESWCVKLGRRSQQVQNQQLLAGEMKTEDDRETSVTLSRDENGDVKMEM